VQASGYSERSWGKIIGVSIRSWPCFCVHSVNYLLDDNSDLVLGSLSLSDPKNRVYPWQEVLLAFSSRTEVAAVPCRRLYQQAAGKTHCNDYCARGLSWTSWKHGRKPILNHTFTFFAMSNPLDTDAGSELFSNYEAELKLVQADLNQKLDQIPELTGEERKSAIRGAERAVDEAKELVWLPPFHS
jgi:hypothetical protein